MDSVQRNYVRQTRAVIFLLFSVLAYSLFPLIGTYIDTLVNPILFIGLSHLFALVALTSVTAILMARGWLRLSAIRSAISGRFVLMAAASGTVNAASHACLFGSFIYMSSASATALYEVWPAGVVVFIRLLLPRQYSRLTIRQWMFVAMAIVGVALLIESAITSAADTSQQQTKIAVGVSLALLSAVLMAVSSGLDVALCRRLDIIEAPFLQPIVSQNAVKVFSATCTLIVYVVLFRPRIQPMLVRPVVIAMAAGTGFFVIAFGAVAYHIGNILAESPSINVLWYLTPVLALLWLDVCGVATITPGIAIGAILIISANLLLTTRADPQTAYAGTLGGICLSAFFCTYVRGTNDDHYYDMIAAATGVFAILAAFMLQRVSEKARRVSNAAMELLESVRRSASFTAIEKQTISQRILDFVELRSRRLRHTLATPVPFLHRGLDRDVDSLSRALIASRAQVISFGEMVVLVMLAGLSLVIAHLSRPYSFTGDLVPVVLTGVMVFLCVRVFQEEHGDLMSDVLSVYRETELVGHEDSPPAAGYRGISIALLLAVFVIYVIVVSRKHGIPFKFNN